MTKDRKFRIAHVTGHVFWWVFVVAILFPGDTRADATVYIGAYQPLHDSGDIYHASDGFCAGRPLAIVALAVVVIAATVEAVIVHRQTPGLITVAVPLCAGLVIWQSTPDPCGGGPRSAGLFTLGIVLLAVAAREIWARFYAPVPAS